MSEAKFFNSDNPDINLSIGQSNIIRSTGELWLKDEGCIRYEDDRKWLVIQNTKNKETYEEGPYILLNDYNKNDNTTLGVVEIAGRLLEKNTRCMLYVTPELISMKKEINGVTEYSGLIDVVIKQSINYTQYANGLLICYDQINIPENSTITITFPISFINTPNITLTTKFQYINTPSWSNTNFQVTSAYTTASLGISYIAIGRWK